MQTDTAQTSLQNRQSRQFLNTALLIGVLALSTIMAAVPYSGGETALAPQESITGEWTAEFQKEKADHIQLTLIRRSAKGHNSTNGFGIPLSELQGLTREQAFGAGTGVRFRLAREAGTFEFEGTFREGKGAGSWTLTPSQSFISAMQARGIDNLTEEQRVASAMLDVRTKTVDDLKSAGFTNLSIDDVFKATIFKITPEYITELKSLGYENLGLEELVKARIFKIDAEFAREVEAMGFGRGPLE
ncbi:MAG: hypothetical protein LC672_05375, partial [Acidobacteria bacterium]|nr:hypothetical protein [Acidobacteriota bacterium]